MKQAELALERARYWRGMLLGYANPGTMAAFIVACEPLRPEDGPLARQYLKLARWLRAYLRNEARRMEQAVRRAARHSLRAPVYEFFDGLPCVRGEYHAMDRQPHLVWQCPHCGQEHRLPWDPPQVREEIMSCLEHPDALCLLEIRSFTMPLLIPAYIPRRTT